MVSVQDLRVGARIRLTSEKIAEVLENPRDGMWLLVRDVEPAEPTGGDQPEYMLHFSEVRSVVED
jgi:hypothetical protein